MRCRGRKNGGFMSDWEACLRRLRKELSAEEFDAEIGPLQPRRVDGKWELYAPNRYLGDAIRRKHLSLIAKSLGVSGKDASKAIVIKVGEPPTGPADGSTDAGGFSEARGAGEPESMKGPKGTGKGPRGRPRKTPGLEPAYTFSNFVVGQCNKSAREAAAEFTKGFDGQSRLLVLIGPVGHGKTHLMHAIGHEILRRRPKTAVQVCHGRVLLQSVVAAIRNGSDAVQRLVHPYKSADVLLFDDLKFIGRSDKTQEEFLGIFDALMAKGGRVVVTSDRLPQHNPKLDNGLRSRLAGGTSVFIDPLDQATAISILRKKAKAKGISLRKNVAERLVLGLAKSNGHEWDVRQLEGAVQSLALMTQGKGGRVTMKLVDEYLRSLTPSLNRRVAVEEVIRVVGDHYGYRPTDIRGKRRFQQLVHARHMAMYLCRELTNQPYAYIGKAFKDRHHTTVKAACVKMGGLMQQKPDARAEYCHLRRKLLGK